MKKLLFVLIFFFLCSEINKASILSVGDEIFALQNSAEISSADPAQALLAEAEEAHFQQNLELEKELLTKALTSNPSEEDRAIAERRLATLDWRFYAQYASASEHLAQAAALKSKRAETLMEKARMETALEKYDDAYQSAKQAIAESPDKKTREQAAFALAAVVKSEILNPRLNGPKVYGKLLSADEKNRLAQAYNLLLPIVTAEAGQLAPSRLLLTLALISNDGPNALAAWRSYYRFEENSSADTILSNAYKKLKAVLMNWSKTKNSRQNYENLTLALADSRMFDEAAFVVYQAQAKYKGKTNNSSRLNDIAEYAFFCRQVQKITNEYYRQTAVKQGNSDAFQKQLFKKAEEFWGRLSDPKDAREYSPENFQKEINKRFGATVNLGTTAGTLDLHMGHSVIDEKRTITQYGKTAEIEFVSLDSIVSNGFQSWVWDGRAQHGGWATATTIIQVRPAYGGNALRAWTFLTDDAERKKGNEEIEKAGLADESKARANPYVFLQGLQKRLFRQGWEQLFARLKSKGLTGSSLKLAYLAEFEKAEIESSIFAHEGRHAIDAKLGLTLTDAEREYRAKLSQIVFSSEPRLNLSSIFDANIGDDTPHGIANLNLMKGLVSWMEANKGSIKELDPSKPLLPQFDLLTDEQIKMAFRSMEPFLKS